MNFETVADFLAMGKHGPYVWSAYGITFALWLGLTLHLRLRRRKVMRDIARQMRRTEVVSENKNQQEVV